MDVCTRPLYRIHRSTVIVLTLALATVVVVNIPGDRSVTHSNRYQHGWPYPYYERDGKPRSWWSFAGSNPELHIPALLLNSLMAGCTTALVACGCELWIRRFGRLYCFSIASMLGLTAIVAVVIGFVVRDVERCYQQQKVLIELAKLGSMSAYREERRLDWLRSLFGSQMDGSVRRVEVVATPLNQTSLPDLAALTDLKFLSLTGVNLGAIDAERLANAPSLEELQLTLTSVRGQSDEEGD